MLLALECKIILAILRLVCKYVALHAPIAFEHHTWARGFPFLTGTQSVMQDLYDGPTFQRVANRCSGVALHL